MLLNRWAEDPAAVGLSPGALAAMQQALDEARAAVLGRVEAAAAARAATAAANSRVGELRDLIGRGVRTVRAFAENSAEPSGVYNQAFIPAPAAPAPLPPPALPTRLTAELEATTGAMALRWKARNPTGSGGGGGTTYIVRRRLPGEARPSFLGIGRSKRFTDTTLPAGAAWVEYTVQGHRAGVEGPQSMILKVHLGAAPGAVGIARAA